ncbi:hypothetical protein SHELI_v1c03980 [Spiroplasma helicoides]|uniref:Transmembrane protein n=1 Tax=Spiroplasma helicoides TaxID=216938 RepID=A0A1B3SK92_9MOLU|nr:lipoprotein [Spiroplasma helicoides]AOG60349.1 hypothetical protein SHELI_v1c03980 [Spiroplasma helicoides]
MKKLLAILGSTTITASSVVGSTYIFNNTNFFKKGVGDNYKQNLDWNELESKINDISKSLENESFYNNFNFGTKIKNNAEFTSAASVFQNKTKSLINDLKNGNIKLENLIEDLKTKVNKSDLPNFNDYYNNDSINDYYNKDKNKNFLENKTSNFITANSFDKNYKLVKTLKGLKAATTTITAVAAVAAAGYWSISWLGFAPNAIAATAVAVASGIATGIIDGLLVEYDTKENIFKKELNLGKYLKAGYDLYKYSSIAVGVLLGTLSATAWSVPSIIPSFAVFSAFMALKDYLEY